MMNQMPLRLVIAFLLISSGAATSGYIFYRYQQALILNAQNKELSSVSDLKLHEISLWRKERLGDARVIFEVPHVAMTAQQYFVWPEDAALGKEIKAWLRSIQESYDYESVVLLDRDGAVRMPVPNTRQTVSQSEITFISEAVSEKRMILSDFHRSEDGKSIQIILAVPLFSSTPKAKAHIGTILLRVDPNRFLYPLIQSWPAPNATAETVLVRRRGDEVEFLNELRHRKNSALSLRFPLAKSDLPAAMAARGIQGFVEGMDYRGVRVFSLLRAIPDSPWYLITKIDQDEVYAPIRYQGRIISFLVILVIVSSGLSLGYYWRKLKSTKEREKSEEILRKSQKRLLEAQQLAHIGNWEWDIATSELQWSDEIYRIFGLSPQQFGSTYEEFLSVVHPDDREAVKTAVNDALYRKEPYIIEHRVVRPDGSQRIVCEQGQVFFDESGTAIRMIGTVQDITERSQAEEEKRRLEAQLRQSQKMETVGTLAGGIAHDFNNILTPIGLGATLAMMQLPKDSSVQKLLVQISNAANRAKDLVRQILIFSRKSEQELQPVRLQEIIDEAVRFLKASLPATIKIKLYLDPACGPVMADSIQIYQVILNLCTNAFRAMRERGGLLEIRLQELGIDGRTGRYARIEVKDTGVGMDAATMEKIFDPFFTTEKAGEGTGLGLSVVHGIVTSHGGTITVESALGKGSTFRVFLPLLEGDFKPEDKAGLEPVQVGTEKVLFLDDDEAIAVTGKATLESLGYQVTAMTDSHEAMEEFRKNPNKYDVVVTDLTMPKMTGLDLAVELHKIRDIPVILTTGYSETITAERLQQLKIHSHLRKPYEISTLGAAIRRALDSRKRTQSLVFRAKD